MLLKVSVTFLLASVAMCMEELDEVTSGCSRTATVESSRCLIQQQRLKAVALQAPQESMELLTRDDAIEDKQKWKSQTVNIEFSASSPDMKSATPKQYKDFDCDESTSKEYLMTNFNRSKKGIETTENPTQDTILMFGFKEETSGIVNSNKDRIWTGDPNNQSSKLVYGFMMTDVPEYEMWKYSVKFSRPPPKAVQMYPKDGRVKQMNDSLFVTLVCDDPKQCKDGDIRVSSVQFVPDEAEKDKKDFVLFRANDKEEDGKHKKEAANKEKKKAAEGKKKKSAGEVHAKHKDKAKSKDKKKAKSKAKVTVVASAKDAVNALANTSAKSSDDEGKAKDKAQGKGTENDKGKSKDKDQGKDNGKDKGNDKGKDKGKDKSAQGAVKVELASISTDLESVTKKNYKDFDYDGNNPKEYLVMDSIQDLYSIHMFGFQPGTDGITSSNKDKIWTANPGQTGAKLVHGLMMTGVPEALTWKYDIQYLQPPPEGVKVYPDDGYCKQINNSLFVTIVCEEGEECKDGDISISSVQFTPKGGSVSTESFVAQQEKADAKTKQEKEFKLEQKEAEETVKAAVTQAAKRVAKRAAEETADRVAMAAQRVAEKRAEAEAMAKAAQEKIKEAAELEQRQKEIIASLEASLPDGS